MPDLYCQDAMILRLIEGMRGGGAAARDYRWQEAREHHFRMLPGWLPGS